MLKVITEFIHNEKKRDESLEKNKEEAKEEVKEGADNIIPENVNVNQ